MNSIEVVNDAPAAAVRGRGEPGYRGLSAFGCRLVAEKNRAGTLVDL